MQSILPRLNTNLVATPAPTKVSGNARMNTIEFPYVIAKEERQKQSQHRLDIMKQRLLRCARNDGKRKETDSESSFSFVFLFAWETLNLIKSKQKRSLYKTVRKAPLQGSGVNDGKKILLKIKTKIKQNYTFSFHYFEVLVTIWRCLKWVIFSFGDFPTFVSPKPN